MKRYCALFVLLLSGCGAARSAATATSARSPVHIACSVAVAYRSLAQLRRAATAIAVLRPTGASRVIHVAGGPYTLATVTVLGTVSGRRLPATLQLRELGGPGVVLDGCFPEVSTGHTYLAYLVPFRRRRNGPGVPGQYFIVGPGLFELAGASSTALGPAARFKRLGPDTGSRLPAQITVRQAARS
jgi:hypothetical protein